MDKQQIKVEVWPGAKESLAKICEQEGMLQVAVISRLLEWFLGQNATVRAIVLGHVRDRQVIEAMLAAVQETVNVPDADKKKAAAVKLQAAADRELARLRQNERVTKAAS